MARTKDMEDVLPLGNVSVNREAIEIDGSKTLMVGDVISQNALEAVLRMERRAKMLSDGAKAARKLIEAAINEGVPVQEGSRQADFEEKNATLSFKDLFTSLLKEAGFDEASVKANCDALGYKEQTRKLIKNRFPQYGDPDQWIAARKDALPKKKVFFIK